MTSISLRASARFLAVLASLLALCAAPAAFADDGAVTGIHHMDDDGAVTGIHH